MASGACDVEIPWQYTPTFGGHKLVNYLEIQIENPVAGAGGYHREFHTESLSNEDNLTVLTAEENKIRAVYGYVCWGWQTNIAAISWTTPEYVNFTWTRFFPPKKEDITFNQDPGFIRIWMRNGVKADYRIFFSDRATGQPEILQPAPPP